MKSRHNVFMFDLFLAFFPPTKPLVYPTSLVDRSSQLFSVSCFVYRILQGLRVAQAAVTERWP